MGGRLCFFSFLTVLSLLTSIIPPAMAAGKGACAADLRRTSRAVDRALEQKAGSSSYAPESRAAKLGHQPTPSSIARAERRFDDWSNGGEAVAAIERARQASKSGDTQGCLDALRAARLAIGAAP
jgi:hypothetical protein